MFFVYFLFLDFVNISVNKCRWYLFASCHVDLLRWFAFIIGQLCSIYRSYFSLNWKMSLKLLILGASTYNQYCHSLFSSEGIRTLWRKSLIPSLLSLFNVWFFSENKAKGGGICVANHTSPIDAILLACDNCYALVSPAYFFSMHYSVFSGIQVCIIQNNSFFLAVQTLKSHLKYLFLVV